MADTHATVTALGRHKAPMLRFRPPVDPLPPLWSHTAGWADLTVRKPVDPMGDLTTGWPRRWQVSFTHGKNVHTIAAASASLADLLAADPMLVNSWHKKKTARAGLRYVASTDFQHAHASLFERKLLLALDFHGATHIVSQPFTLTYELGGRTRVHTPDFLAVIDGEAVVINCRPFDLVKPKLLEDVAAVGAFAVSHGWGNELVVGYPTPAFTTVDTITAHSTIDDPFGFGEVILDLLALRGPMQFAEVADSMESPVIARAVLQSLLWSREVVMDLAELLEDTTLIYLPRHLLQPVA